MQIDLFAREEEGIYSVIGEIKNRKKKKFSLQEAQEF